jgi:hypothetical protein
VRENPMQAHKGSPTDRAEHIVTDQNKPRPSVAYPMPPGE